MELKKLLSGIENFKIKGDEELDIKKVECNSKKVIPNSLFIAIKGFDVDGHKYIKDAIENGAAAVIVQDEKSLKDFMSSLKKLGL